MYANTTESNADKESPGVRVMRILQIFVASVGTVANSTVIVAFLNHKQLRVKIPNRFIVNQVSELNFSFLSYLIINFLN